MVLVIESGRYLKFRITYFSMLLLNKCRSYIANRPTVLRELNTTPNCRYNKKHWPSKFTLTNNNTKTSNIISKHPLSSRYYYSKLNYPNRFFRIEVFAWVIVYKKPSRLTLYFKILYLIIVFFLKFKKHKTPKICSS